MSSESMREIDACPGKNSDLTRKQINFRRNLMDLNPPGRPQTAKGRPVLPIPSTIVAWLKQGTAEHFIHYGGHRYTKWGWDAIFKRLVKRSGLEGVSAYTIRHTIATEMYARTGRFADVRMYLGHSIEALGTTGGYIHLQPDYLQAPKQAVDAFFRELNPLLTRPICDMDLEAQPLSIPQDDQEKIEMQMQPTAELHPRRTPAIEGGTEPVLRNVLNDLVGVRGFAMFLLSQSASACGEAGNSQNSVALA
jgi:Phage integrase family